GGRLPTAVSVGAPHCLTVSCRRPPLWITVLFRCNSSLSARGRAGGQPAKVPVWGGSHRRTRDQSLPSNKETPRARRAPRHRGPLCNHAAAQFASVNCSLTLARQKDGQASRVLSPGRLLQRTGVLLCSPPAAYAEKATSARSLPGW